MASGDSDTREEEVQQNEEGTVISPDELIKHPLQNRWAMWFFKNDKAKEWTANLKLVTAFDTVEDFWGLYNHIQKASKLPPGCDYSLFKDGIQPMWEDSQNKNGGRWLVNLNKNQRMTELDNFWLETLLCLIGEAFDDLSEDICGATINIRNKGDKLGLWTRDARKADATVKIGQKLKERLKIPQKIIIGFQITGFDILSELSPWRISMKYQALKAYFQKEFDILSELSPWRISMKYQALKAYFQKEKKIF